MDPSPITKNVTAHTLFHPPIESGGGYVDFSPRLLNCYQQSVNDSNAEYPPFKKPRTSETPMNSRIPALLNKLNMGIPFKNVLCLQFQRGHCTYGDSCHFAHGVGDTQKLLPQRKELMNQENWKEDQRIISSMKLCRKFYNGEQCPYGARCHFLHEPPAKFRATCFGTPRPGGSLDESKGLECKTIVEPSLNVIQVSQKPAFWKTRLCNKWEATGTCPFGTYCYFAHGHADLRLGSQKTEAANVYTSNTTATAIMHASSSTTGNATACEKKMQDIKCLVKWKGFEKISHIYADWIDDMPLGKVGRWF